MRAYIDSTGRYRHIRSGSNSSDKEDYLDEKGWDSFFDLNFSYVLPLGAMKRSAIHTYVLDRGLLVRGQTGGTVWNPLKSGITTLGVTPFYRYQSIDTDPDSLKIKTNGVKVYLEYDHTDFHPNPSRGSYQRVSISRDFGWGNSTDSWTEVEAEAAKYFSLGASPMFRQRVIALDVWTADTPTWKKEVTPEGIEIRHRSPYYMGARLGGIYRMRGYPMSRFNGKAAVYYSAEYRVIPRWHPLGEVPWIKKWLQWDYWQVVPFVEAGRGVTRGRSRSYIGP
jgi:hypothetical protein